MDQKNNSLKLSGCKWSRVLRLKIQKRWNSIWFGLSHYFKRG